MQRAFAYYINTLRMDFVQYCSKKMKDLEISHGLIYFILFIGKNPGCSLGTLAQSLHSDGGHTTRSVEKLVKQGYVERKRAPYDRRTAILNLTPEGQQVFESCRTWFNDWQKLRTAALTQEEVQQLCQLLHKTVQDIEQFIPTQQPLQD